MSTRSRAESIGGSVRLKTVTEMTWSITVVHLYSRECLPCTEFFVGLGAKLCIIHRPLQVAQALTKMGRHK